MCVLQLISLVLECHGILPFLPKIVLSPSLCQYLVWILSTFFKLGVNYWASVYASEEEMLLCGVHMGATNILWTANVVQPTVMADNGRAGVFGRQILIW